MIALDVGMMMMRDIQRKRKEGIEPKACEREKYCRRDERVTVYRVNVDVVSSTLRNRRAQFSIAESSDEGEDAREEPYEEGHSSTTGVQ